MIRTFRCSDTAALFAGERVARFANIAAIATRKLQQIDSAVTLDSLRAPPGNRLEQLKGNRRGQHSIRINDRWRVCFVWKGDGVLEVEIVDYHREATMTIRAPKNGMRPIHPGEVLREDFLKPLGMSANALAKALRVPASRVNDIVLERRGVTVDTAMRLVRYFGGDVQTWLNLQTAYDLKVAEKTIAAKIAKDVEPMAA
jgi:addiction module HigA family antidote